MTDRNGQPGHQPTPTAGVILAAMRAGHLAHCPEHRAQHAEDTARYAEYGESIRRRDRVQLGLRIVTPRPAVQA